MKQKFSKPASPLAFLGLLIGVASTAASAQDATPPEGMVFVPGGVFTMGSARGDMHGNHDIRLFGDAQPVRKVNVAPFFMDKTEVTNAQYKKFCDATGYAPPPHWKNGKFPEGEGNFAVTHVNWWEAKAYAAWAGKRLPSEEEWEKAARGTDGRSYPWGETWNPALAVTRAPKAQAVGTKPEGASPYGVLDMTGNAFEWVADWYMAYPGATEKFPEFGKNFKVVRGGGFDGSLGFPPMYSAAYRSVTRPQTRSEWVGFRCAKDAK